MFVNQFNEISKSNSFTMLSLNTQSLHAKFAKLILLLEVLGAKNLEFSAICIQETWLDNNSDLSLFQIDNYSCIAKGKYCTAHGGLIIYLHN